MNITTKKQFIELLEKIYACEPAIDWCKQQKSLKDIFKCTSANWWTWLLSHQPQFADKCDFSLFSGYNLSCLLRYQPQFADRCDFSLFSGADWLWLLVHKPQFADRCDFSLFSEADWLFLLRYQPQLEKYRTGE